MSGPATATVETLTAEVRVLMVGNRQITLSVAKQLDYVNLDQLTVFGRIKLGNTASDLIIGADPDGGLALAHCDPYRKPHNWRAFLEVGSDLEPPVVGWDARRGSGENSDCYTVAIVDVPCLILVRDCVTPEMPLGEYRLAVNAWISARNDWWDQHNSGEGFAESEPKRPDGNFWNPGPHRERFIEQARQQLAEAECRHRLYEAAKAAPLIVLAGLR